MNTPIKVMLCLTALSLVAIAGCGGGEPADTAAGGPPSAQHKNLFAGMPKVMESKDNPLTDEKIDLGRVLYYEARMSASNDFIVPTTEPMVTTTVSLSSESKDFSRPPESRPKIVSNSSAWRGIKSSASSCL